MKRLTYIFLAIGLALGFCASSYGQSCYSQAYGGAQAESFALSAGETQTFTVPVQVTVTTPRVAVAAPAPVAAPQPSCGAVGYAAPQAVAVPYAVPVAVPFVASYSAVGYGCQGAFGLSQGYGHSVARRVAFGQAGYFGGAAQFGAVGGLSNIVARDRRGTAVSANFQNNVRIRRGLLGNIRSVEADGNRGAFGLGRFNPF
jgi:hypothetical protein